MPWERFVHAADIGVRGTGRTPAEVGADRGDRRAQQVVDSVVDAAQQAGLARKVARLEPLVCIKG